MTRISIRRLALAAGVTALALLGALSAPPQPQAVVAQDSAKEKTSSAETDYLIVAADDLVKVGKEWADYRKGHGRKAKVVALSEIAREAGRKLASLMDIKAAIKKEAGGETPREGFQVMLLGDCPAEGGEGYDPKVEIPWFMSRYKDAYQRSTIPGDNFLADIVGDDNEIPDVAIGRIPARTPEQALAALAKVKAYETARTGPWQKRLTFFAGEGRFGPAIDAMLEKLFADFAEQVIDPAYDLRMTYANIRSAYAWIPSQFTEKVLEEANEGALILSYMGHGSKDRLDDMQVKVGDETHRYPILQDKDVANFDIPEGRLPVMIIVACATGYLDGKNDSLTEKIIFQDKAPVAVISSSRDSHPYSNTILQNGLISEITGRHRATLGEAYLRAKRELILAEDKNRAQIESLSAFILPRKERDALNAAHLYLYNLTGDPGLRLKQPNFELSCEPIQSIPGARIEAEIMTQGDITLCNSVTATLEVRRSQIFHEIREFSAADLVSADEKAREKAEAIVSANHNAANNKVVAEGDCTGGGGYGEPGKGPVRYFKTITATVPEDLAPGNYFLKVAYFDEEGKQAGVLAVPVEVKAKEK